MKFGLRQQLILLGFLSTSWLWRTQAQTADGVAKPLPDIPTLMREVEAHQKASETLVRDYLYHSHAVEQTLNSQGSVKKTETEDADIFYVAGARIRRITMKDGRELSESDREKENRRIDKDIAKAKEKASKPAENERDVLTVSRFLELGSFSNPRRATLEGRDTIVVDFTGDAKAKTRTSFEGALRQMEGTIWVDEQDRSLRKLEGHFVRDFKVGAGIVADVRKGTSFQAQWTKVNGEVWLPASAGGRGDVRIMLFVNMHGSLRVTNSAYRKFKATATILPATPSKP